MILSMAPMDLTKIVQDAIESFQGAALQNRQSLERKWPDQKVMVKGDADRLTQVMANLLSNATKFTPPGGRILVSMEDVIEDGRPSVRVAVQDSGPGIPREMQDKLFDKFQQVDRLIKEKTQGSGLGLALVREIIAHHGGRVGVESEAGAGSAFFFILPLPAPETRQGVLNRRDAENAKKG